ncbi:MULE domain-containing protein [Abeliophyllum distichum]|uniref:MULE domain-containing protein n=1 Tax=Abeliophyllum distichum TaxID=126358 RepID=A0ABD1PSE5_9LAMI
MGSNKVVEIYLVLPLATHELSWDDNIHVAQYVHEEIEQNMVNTRRIVVIEKILGIDCGQPESQPLYDSKPTNTQVEIDDIEMVCAQCDVEIEQEKICDGFIDIDYEQEEVEIGEHAYTTQQVLTFLFECRYVRTHIDKKDSYQANSDDLQNINNDNEYEGNFGSHLLSAVGIDADNTIYPIAYAVVESENMASWNWFVDLLCNNVGMRNSHGWTFINDKQKGLIDALNV